jgi:hypothetical protein
MAKRSEYWWRARAENQMVEALTVAIEARATDDPYYKRMYTSSAVFRLSEAVKALEHAERLRIAARREAKGGETK